MIKAWLVCMFIGLGVGNIVKAEETGSSWRRVDEGFGDRFTTISWDGPLLVGVGPRGLLATSPDAKSWTVRFTGVNANLTGLAWNGSHFVAVGRSGTILRSVNGIDWERIAAPTDQHYAGLTWTGTQFIAVDSYYLSTSADGLTWNRFAITLNLSSGIDHFDGATYLRTSGGLYRSTDLVQWTGVLTSSNTVYAPLRKLNGKLYAVGPSDRIYSSTDGIVWTPGTKTGVTFPTQDLRDIAWNGNTYIAVGASNRVWRSTDGLTWSGESAVTQGPAFVRWINGEWVTAGFLRIPQTSPDGREWTTSADNAKTYGNATVWTGTRYITVGNYGYIATHSDSEGWTSRDSGIYDHLDSVIWTGTFALASGVNGVVLRSADGLTWTPITSAGFGSSIGLGWNGTQAFVFSSTGTHTSTNGSSWTQLTTTPASSGISRDLKWLRGMFIRVKDYGSIETSPDGATWTLQNSGTTANLLAVGASDSEFLVAGQNSTLLASSNGIDWTTRTSPASSPSSIVHHFGRWFMATSGTIYQSTDGIAWSEVPGIKPIYVSPHLVWIGSKLSCTVLNAETGDGITWQQKEIPATPPDFKKVEKGHGGYVAVGSGGTIYHSTDGYAWEPATSPTRGNLEAVAEGNGTWVAVGADGLILSSPDGVTWTQRSSGTPQNLRDVAWNGQRFAAVGGNGAVLSSSNGRDWTVHPLGTTFGISHIESAGQAFKGFSNYGGMLESPDGITWSFSIPPWIADVTWNGSSYVAVGAGSVAHVSGPDALHWTRHPIGITGSSFFTGICWTGTQLVACGQSGHIMTSPDGITWTHRESGTTKWIQAVTWNGSQLVAVGQGATLLYSADGINWSNGTKSFGTLYDFEDVAWANGRYVAVGQNNASATSTDGMHWVSLSGSPGSNLTVESIGTRFITGGSSGLYTTTGTQWLSQLAPASGIYDFEWNGSELFAATSNGVARFVEGPANRWTTSYVYSASVLLDNMVRNGNEYVATGAYGTIVVSPDGNSWQTAKGGWIDTFAGMAWNGSRVVGVGSARIMVSPDGSGWNTATGVPNFSGSEVIWTGSRFLAMGNSGVSRSTGNQDAWTSIANPALSPSDVSGAAGDDELLVAVGPGGMIAVSDSSGDEPSSYQIWMSTQGASSDKDAPLQDANADGIGNLMAYIHGIPAVAAPTPAERSALPTLSFDAITGAPLITFELRESYRPGASYFVEVSPDMKPGSWQAVQQYSAGWGSGPDQAVISESPLPGGGVRITVSGFPESEGSAGGFFRLRALLP